MTRIESGRDGKQCLLERIQQKDSVSVQTDEIFLCHKCSFEGEDIYDLEAHTYSEHSTGEF